MAKKQSRAASLAPDSARSSRGNKKRKLSDDDESQLSDFNETKHMKIEEAGSDVSEDAEETKLGGHSDEEEVVDGEGPILNPKEMSVLAEEFFDFAKQKDLIDKKLTGKKLVGEFLHSTNSPVTTEQFLRSYQFYSKKSLPYRTIQADQILLSALFDRPASVELFPDFPAQPPNLLQYYARKHGINTGFGRISAAKERMLKDVDGQKAAEAELLSLEMECRKKLADFLAVHSDDLSTVQKQHIQKKMSAINKKLNPEPPKSTPRTSKKTQQAIDEKAKPLDVYDMFKRSKAPEYEGMDPEKLERKLRKKFEKLSPEQLQIYESIYFSL